MLSRVLVVVLSLVLSIALVGCSSGGEPSDEGGPTTAPMTTAAAPTPTPSPEVLAASGEKVTIVDLGTPLAEYRAPTPRWEVTGTAASLFTLKGPWDVRVYYGKTYPEVSLDDTAAIALRSARRDFETVERIANRTVDGIEGYVLEGSEGKTMFYEFGVQHAGAFVALAFDLPVDSSSSRGIVESVLASVEWQ